MTRPITPRHIIRFAISVLIVAGIFFLATDARALSSPTKPDYTPVDHWTSSWEARVSFSSLTPTMLDEWERIYDLYPLWVPEPPEPPEPVHTGMGTNVEQWRGLVSAYFAPGDVDLALRIMGCESGGNPNAKNPTSSASGLFQHLGRFWADRSVRAGWSGADIFDPEANIAVAAWLRNDGWHHWNPSRHCWG